jgi:hypothetical protein
MATINAALSDGKITRDEIEKIHGAERDLQTVAATVTGSLEGMADD